jgi:hypothetical protein
MVLGDYEQVITLSPVAAMWSLLYLPPWQAFAAMCVGYIFSACVLEERRYNFRKRVVNVFSLIASSAGMVTVYAALVDRWITHWPSLAAGVAGLFGALCYDAINVATLSLPLHYVEKVSWREIFWSWLGYVYYPICTTAMAMAMALFVTGFELGIPLLCLLLVLFLKPVYNLPKIRL